MAYYTELQFNSGLFMADVKIMLEELHAKAVQNTITKISSGNLASVWKDPYVQYVTNSMSDIVTDSIQAFIKIYGSGSQMDTSSPYYDDYIKSDMFNKIRRKFGNQVAYRPYGPYQTYDWENDSRSIVTRQGSGRGGVYKGFKETPKNPRNMSDVLRSYLICFHELYNNEFCPKLNAMFEDLKY